MVWAFGSFVAVNPKNGDIEHIAETLKPFTEKYVKPKFVEEYKIIIVDKLPVENEEEFVLEEDVCYITPSLNRKLVTKLIGFVLAQSVALERIEESVDRMLERALELLNSTHSILRFKVRSTIRELARVMLTRVELYSDLMLLTKPTLAWESEELEKLYDSLREYFEIDDRFEAVDRQLESIQELSSIVADIMLASRETILEILIILLILVELVLGILF